MKSTRTAPQSDLEASSEGVGSLLVLLPAYNEEKAIGKVIRAVRKLSDKLNDHAVDILVVDGHSADRTPAIAEDHGARVVEQPNKGKGEAVRYGLSMVAEQWAVVMLDADGSYRPDDIAGLLEALRNGADVAIGSRTLGTIEEGAMPPIHRVGNRILSSLASLLYGVSVADICSGMWAFRSSALARLNLNANHFELEAELFAQAAKARLRVVEVPIVYLPRIGSPKLRSVRAGWSIALKLIRKRFAP